MNDSKDYLMGFLKGCALIFIFLFCISLQSDVQAFTLNVVDGNGNTITGGFRWLLEEDATHHVIPGTPGTNWAIDFHRSYMPLAVLNDGVSPAKGHATGNSTTVDVDSSNHYFVSVLPDSGYTIGGAQVAAGQGSVTVYVNQLPLPTAQISIFVFEDNWPINNAPDLPEEQGLAGFSILVEDAGGRYGMSAGMQSQDAFGNPLGTTYQTDASGQPILNPDGTPVVLAMGNGVILTDANGMATIKYLAPGKYGIQAVPPTGTDWVQTSTIEGTKVIDAWVKANEPPFFAEFGPPGWHVFIGFVSSIPRSPNTRTGDIGNFINDPDILTGGGTITGQVVNLHLSRPPDFAFYNGAPLEHTTAWVGLNDNAGLAGTSKGIFAARAQPDGRFTIPNVPPGDYQLVVWDEALDIVFAFHGVTVPDGGVVALGDVPVFQWFTRLENWVFSDDNNNGIWDMNAGEMGMPEQAVNLRWRDGTMYQSMATDIEGFVPFDEIFPFFSWLVAEVDFARWGATGVTVTVDDGGPINFNDPWTFGGQLNPQPQPENGNAPYRVETGPVLTQGFQGFLGQTSVLQWGKKAYGPTENGGISGIVFYSTTRAEDDPAFGAAEPWEPGIPRVRVNLYDSAGTTLLNTTTTDSWDDSLPTDCPGDPSDPFYDPFGTDPMGRCYDGMRNWNQVRPALFDGGYAFTSCYLLDGQCVAPGTTDAVEGPLPAGTYVVEVVTPTGYRVVGYEDKNVDFGDNYEPSPLLVPPICVGAQYTELNPVPAQLSLFPGVDVNPLYANKWGASVPSCDRKLVYLSGGKNAAADFFLFTEVPISGHFVGFILDDTANEFDPTSPQFGEKYAPPWLPVSIRDWTGRIIGQTYSDQWGRYNALVPSTYTANLPQPSGVSPNMITTCMNDSEADPLGFHNPQYSTFCYTFQYMPGATTYLDTPVIPVAAFAGHDQFPLDCEFPDGTPRIKQVDNGPYVANAGDTITIQSMGTVQVPNPTYCPGPPLVNDCTTIDPNKTIPRDYGFGAQGAGSSVTINGTLQTITEWNNDWITVEVTNAGQLVVNRDNGKSAITGVTVTVGGPTPIRVPTDYTTIQEAIDANATAPGDLILVAPGTYNEMVIMWKPVKLQGYGEGSTIINAVKGFQSERLIAWRNKVQTLITSGAIDLLPGQPLDLFTEEGAGVLVLAKATGANSFVNNPNARIDGLTIKGADQGGGIVVNGYADYLNISNNRIINNSGFFGGGVRVGHPELTVEQGNNIIYQDADNDYANIHHNHITQNGGLGGAGGGVSLCTGSDNYAVNENFICGNFSLRDGGGIGHLGLSNNGMIARNTILFNENFNQGQTVSGGGIFIGGVVPLTPGGLSPGSGSVKVIGNLIQGNAAGVGDGGGIRTSSVNGEDVAARRNDPDSWYSVDIFNNMIVNNVAALAGGGISMQDTARINIIHNTIANNESTATASLAFSPGNPNQSNPQPAGIVSRAHSTGLEDTIGNGNRARPYKGFSKPRLVDNIVWHNRSFYFFGDPDAVPPVPYGLLPDPATPVYWDLAVLGTAIPGFLNPDYCILSSLTDAWGGNYLDGTNREADPLLVFQYLNGGRGTTVLPGEPTTALQVPAAFDEGGNFIRVRFGPLTSCNDATPGDGFPGTCSNYHITNGSPAVNNGLNLIGSFPVLATDYDMQVRPNSINVDIGADEYYAAP